MSGLFSEIRKDYHRKIGEDVLGSRGEKKGMNNADTSSRSSRLLARLMAENMGVHLCAAPPKGQTAGTLFGQYTMEFVQAAFNHLRHLRPGDWVFSATGGAGIANFDQYQHLLDLKKVLDENPQIKSALGGDYLVVPDIIIARSRVTDDEINRKEALIAEGEKISTHTPLRASNQEESGVEAILHASISCKWTMRSDRAQNTRTEALNLIRNRKGHLPHVVAVTLEPLPTRIASIAMGTGDIDCTYHGALNELVKAAKDSGLEDQEDMLNTLIEGRRLRDISDLPLDLAV